MTVAAEGKGRVGAAEAAAGAAGAVRRARDGVGTAWQRMSPPLARAVASVAARLSVVSPVGWALALAAVVSAALGFVFGWRELIAAAVVVVVLFATAALFVIGRSAYRVDVDLARARVVVGELAFGTLLVANRTERRLPPARVELPVGRAVALIDVPRLAVGEELEELFNVPTQRRAVLTLGPVRSVRRDPLGLLRRVLRLTEPGDLFVHPRTVRLAQSSSGYLRDLEGLPTRDLSNDDVSFHALREYAPGDDLRHVHWKSTARSQQIMVRQFEETRRSQVAILLSTRADDYADDAEFEAAVGMAGSVGLQAIAEGKEVSLHASSGVRGSGTAQRLLDSLSGVGLAGREPSVDAAARTLSRVAPRASVVFVVCGSRVDAASLRRAALGLPASARAIAVRSASTEPVARRELGALTVLTVPELGDLPAAMARTT